MDEWESGHRRPKRSSLASQLSLWHVHSNTEVGRSDEAIEAARDGDDPKHDLT